MTGTEIPENDTAPTLVERFTFATPTPATEDQVRKHLEDQGYEVHIAQPDGFIQIRELDDADAFWKHARYVSEYVVVEGKVVLT